MYFVVIILCIPLYVGDLQEEIALHEIALQAHAIVITLLFSHDIFPHEFIIFIFFISPVFEACRRKLQRFRLK